ncbi:MAG: flagellar biosynthesis protein FlhA [Pseudomonadaceae bacterium]|nr:flagellar biosynthesis protein FlhA [Pseudomonadaceae bacterium]
MSTLTFRQMGDATRSNLGVPLLLLALLAMMTLRLPTFLLDVLFTFNIALAVVVLLVSVYALRPLEFAAFPTVLLIATLLRLGLNVASTRVVLLDGHAGGDAAGKVIESFGEVVVGGNYVVGLVVFIILVIINFVVVTKGAGRISEVSARFTLDAMPGKQMAIDADLNAGLIDSDQARLRREEVSQEADFYGSMDGASKFVRGDAVAGILILLINIIGGLGIGMAQHDLSFTSALENYTLLTIGDGLVAQIPSLLLSTSAAIMVTRVSSSEDMGTQVNNQLFDDPRALYVTSLVLFILGVIPGMPHVVFLSLSVGIAGFAWWRGEHRQQERVDAVEEDAPVEVVEPKNAEVSWDDVSPVDSLGLEVGYRLIPLVDKGQGGELLGRIRGVRKKLSQELGFLIPSVHIRDNLELAPNDYRISVMGVSVADAQVYPDKWLAIDPGEVFGKVEGLATVDPAFGLPAVWIEGEEKENAETLGYTVVDASTVIATHLNQLMQSQAASLFGHDEAEALVSRLAESSPKLAEQLTPSAVSMPVLLKVLRALLTERVPVRDIKTIALALIEASARNSDPDYLLAMTRVSLGPVIVQGIFGGDQEMQVITLDPELESLLVQAQSQGSADAPVLEPGMAERLQQSINDVADEQEVAGKPTVLLVAQPIRALLARFARFTQRSIYVMCFDEIPENKQITIVRAIGRSGEA